MKMINITIDGQAVSVSEGTTLLHACKKIGKEIPTLCYMNLHAFGIHHEPSNCRVCLVEIEGRPTLATSCSEKAVEGMVVHTDTPRVVNARRSSVELLLSNHPKDCLVCTKNLQCDLQKLAADMEIREIRYQGEMMDYEEDRSSSALIKNPNKCIMCRRCETMCNEVQSVGALSALNRSFQSYVGPAFHWEMSKSPCTFCGQCVAVCPTAALSEHSHAHAVFSALENPKKHVIVQVAPAIRVAIGEMFGLPQGTLTTGKLVTSLKMLGFDGVFDTNWAADLTIVEEASELVHRIKDGGTLPLLTSCCPAWVQFIENNFPDLLDIPSSCQSPMMMFGAMAKTYYAQKKGLDPKDIVVVSLMPCLAKKAEAKREELSTEGHPNVDIVISTREYARMLKQFGIDLSHLKDSDFDSIMGQSTGAGAIFGTTGGVIEAAVRTAHEMITGKELEKVDYTELRGMKGIREANVKIGDLDVKIGIAHGLGNARKLLEEVQSGQIKYHAIEIMACPGGCIGGGGQPYHHGDINVIRKRQQAIYQEDKNKTIRKSHKNPEIITLYEEFLGEPYGEKAHELLHTDYTPRETI